MIGSKELGLRPDGTNVQKVGCWQGPVRGKVGWSERRSLWEVCFFWIVWRGVVSGTKKTTPNGNIPPKPRTVAWTFWNFDSFLHNFTSSCALKSCTLDLRRKIQRFGVMIRTHLLVGRLNQPTWKICSSNCIISPGRGENWKYLKPPSSLLSTKHLASRKLGKKTTTSPIVKPLVPHKNERRNCGRFGMTV